MGVRSHQPGPDWCANGQFLTQFDLDGDRRYSPHDAPIVGQAVCCSPTYPTAWGWCGWVHVGPYASHQPGPAWCPSGTFLTQFDLDGDRSFAPHDAPIVGQAKCCGPNPSIANWRSCQWVPVGPYRSHQPGPAWCPSGTFLTQFDLDGDRNLAPHDAPIVGQALCCSP